MWEGYVVVTYFAVRWASVEFDCTVFPVDCWIVARQPWVSEDNINVREVNNMEFNGFLVMTDAQMLNCFHCDLAMLIW